MRLLYLNDTRLGDTWLVNFNFKEKLWYKGFRHGLSYLHSLGFQYIHLNYFTSTGNIIINKKLNIFRFTRFSEVDSGMLASIKFLLPVTALLAFFFHPG